MATAEKTERVTSWHVTGARLATFREAAGLTQASLADRFCVGADTVASAEQGRRALQADFAAQRPARHVIADRIRPLPAEPIIYGSVMTTTEPRPDLRPPSLNTDEKTTLLTFLDYLRESVLAKAAGVPEPAVRTAGVPSGTSLLQLIKHLTAVELNWFVWAYAGADREHWEDEGPVSADDTASDLADAYRQAIARANEIALACTDLDRPGVRSLRETPPPSMRWVLVHMIEETARHAGHADILREQIDGSTGR